VKVTQEHEGPVPASPAPTTGDQVLTRWWRAVRTVLGHALLLPVYLWRSTAALRTPRCRFHPSCSTYALDAVGAHGPARGGVLAARRVGRCHPWNPGGIDPVPLAEDRDAWRRRYVSSHQRTSN
jgi:uncharacterized protein